MLRNIIRCLLLDTLLVADAQDLFEGWDNDSKDIAHSLRLITGKTKPVREMTDYEKIYARIVWERRIAELGKGISEYEARVDALQAEVDALKKDLGGA